MTKTLVIVTDESGGLWNQPMSLLNESRAKQRKMIGKQEYSCIICNYLNRRIFVLLQNLI